VKTIFLDIDGVLCTRRAWSNRPEGWTQDMPGEFHLPVQRMFEDWLIENPEVRIVLSSTWRLTRNPDKLPFGWKFRIGKESPIILEKIIDTTPRHVDCFRGREIQEWLDSHPEVTQFAILDDDSFDQIHTRNFVLVNRQFGMTRENLKDVSKILSLSSSSNPVR
jgi:hypothetical protein